MKKLLALMLALCLILSCGILPASAAEIASGSCGSSARWSLSSDGTLTISGKGKMYDYEGAMLGMPADSVNEAPWFFDHAAKVTKVVIEPGITRIGDNAFCNLNSLKDVQIPGTVKSIGADAFHWTAALEEIVIPEGVETIETAAFLRSYVKVIHLPSTLKSIGASAFDYCGFLEEVHFAGNAPEVGSALFNTMDSTWEDYIRVDAYYPEGNPTWTEEAMKAFGGWKTHTTWIPVSPYGEDGFYDVNEYHWFYDAVVWAVDNGITNGLTATTFGPEEFCKRSQVVTFLHRAMGKPVPGSVQSGFSDVKVGEFYTDAVAWAVENGITNGMGDGTFGTERTCTRAQVVTFLWRAAGCPEPESTECPFTDVKSDNWYTDAVLWAVENGITNGMDDTTFGVDNTCTRAQIVTFLCRFAG